MARSAGRCQRVGIRAEKKPGNGGEREREGYRGKNTKG